MSKYRVVAGERPEVDLDLVFVTIDHLRSLVRDYGHIIGYQTFTVNSAIGMLQALVRERDQLRDRLNRKEHQ